ncbi:MAG TPA: NfeD family protein [Phycisphaerae bacterium]|nr:NfeD family protein [Phycisphaerae bacterium]
MHWDLVFTVILLFLAAAASLFAELFVPAHGLLALICAALTIAGVAVCFFISQIVGIFCAIATVICLPVVFYLAIKFYPLTPVGRRVVLGRPDPESTKGFASQQSQLAAMVGQEGVAATVLRPVGTCVFGSQRIACVSESLVIAAGTPVRAMSVSGGQLIVRPLTPATAARPADSKV